MKITDIIKQSTLSEDATGGATGSGAIATVPGVGSGPKVGTLFGGAYKHPKKRKTK